MNLTSKKILLIDLEKLTYEVKSYTELQRYVGGVGLGLKLMDMFGEKDPLIISIGPLNGFFPYASKTSIVVNDGGVIEDFYIGGTMAARMRFTGIDSIVLNNTAESETILEILNSDVSFKRGETSSGSLGLPGRRSILSLDESKALLDSYFTTPEYFLENKFAKKNIKTISLTGTEVVSPLLMEKYQNLYHTLLARKHELSVNESSQPSCVNCPMGCERSKTGELGGNVLIHSLVACQYAEKIYSDVGIIFSCLNILGYDYTHEDIENLPGLIEETLKKLS
ncbi:hypothetical protein C4561_03960 [candidate division WWE3 bacterium]|jgi:aldehyde:ferredoxin oxidoreductase|uniref:Aldehyde ferredoxin oxidoreductase N-terminal domain-containing protein n=1 Tax=candidate division WWE3 bacterium TaxID=2053526 RepID=A0A3A4ZCC0_UNCKA|nr:MAG: hypothetical protein C4561_03960 [candidate division WWE3 bacterium]